jgi:hypothetical protein
LSVGAALGYPFAMTGRFGSLLRFAWLRARAAVSALLSGLWTGLDIDEIEARLAARPLPEQALLVGGVLALLFGLSLVFAQAGIGGIVAFWIVVALIAR